MTWKGRGFDSFDQIGYLFWIAFFLIIKFSWKNISAISDLKYKKAGVLFFYFSILLSITSFLIDLKYLLGISLIFYITSLVWMAKGWKSAIVFLPLLGIFYLGFPKITLQINAITSGLLGLSGWNIGWVVRIIFLILFWSVSIKLSKRLSALSTKKTTLDSYNVSIKTLLTSAILTLSLQVYINSQPKFEKMNSQLELSYYLNGWIGQKTPISKQSITYFGQSNIWSRSYSKENKIVQILINASGGNRHRNHPPEYCMTGNGWGIVESIVSRLKVGKFDDISLTKMKMRKDQQISHFYYWFTDGEIAYPNYFQLMIEDSKRRLLGNKTNWYLVRVISENENDLKEFLKHMNYNVFQ
jgi:EpsI family protein